MSSKHAHEWSDVSPYFWGHSFWNPLPGSGWGAAAGGLMTEEGHPNPAMHGAGMGALMGGAATGLGSIPFAMAHPGHAALATLLGAVGGATGGAHTAHSLSKKKEKKASISMFSFFDELKKIGEAGVMGKIAADLTQAAREKIKSKNFALTSEQSSTGEKAYPIHDRRHAANALSRVAQHGSPKQKAEVYKDVAKKYPDLARKSDVPALKSKAASALGKLHGAITKHPYKAMAASALGGLAAGEQIGHKHEKEKDSQMGSMGASALPGTIGGPPGGMGVSMTPPMVMPGKM